MREMFTELSDELFDLTVTQKGIGNALYANEDEGGACCASCSCSLCISLCCCILCF